jgi:hypothetical protein
MRAENWSLTVTSHRNDGQQDHEFDADPDNEYDSLRPQHERTGFRGHDVVDPSHRLIGTISDVVFDTGGDPQWAVVDLGLLRSSHYLPIASGYMSEAGEFVVPYDKKVVKSAPKADRSHLVDAGTRHELQHHYEII